MANLPLGRRKRSHEIVELIEGAIASGNKGEQRRKVGELIEVLSRSDR